VSVKEIVSFVKSFYHQVYPWNSAKYLRILKNIRNGKNDVEIGNNRCPLLRVSESSLSGPPRNGPEGFLEAPGDRDEPTVHGTGHDPAHLGGKVDCLWWWEFIVSIESPLHVHWWKYLMIFWNKHNKIYSFSRCLADCSWQGPGVLGPACRSTLLRGSRKKGEGNRCSGRTQGQTTLLLFFWNSSWAIQFFGNIGNFPYGIISPLACRTV